MLNISDTVKIKYRLFSFVVGVLFLCCFSSKMEACPLKLEGKVGAYFPESSRIREIFHTMPYVELEGSYAVCSSWDLWGGVGCIFGNGKSLECGNKTSIQVIPFSLGVRTAFCLTPCLNLVLATGGLWSLYYNQDHSSFVHKNISDHNLGGIFKGGLEYQLNCQWSLTSNIEYMIQRFSFHRRYKDHFTYRNDVSFNGIKLNVGIGYSF